MLILSTFLSLNLCDIRCRIANIGHCIKPNNISSALDPVKITFISSFDLISKKRGM